MAAKNVPSTTKVEAAGPGPGAQVELDDAPGQAEAEDGQRQHGEVDDGQQPTLVRRRLQRGTLVVREAGEGVDDGGEVGRRRPWGARVLGLVEERRHPGHEEHDADRHRDQRRPRSLLRMPAPPAAEDRDDEPDPDHRHQIDGPVLRIEERRGHDGNGDEVAGPGCVDGPAQRQEAAAGQEDDQRVHARLRRVVHGEGGAGQQHDGRPGQDPAPEALAAEPAHREGHHRDDSRQRPHGVVRLPEEDDPEVQEVVVEGRRPVVFERVRDLAQRQPGDVDGEGLVEPEGRSGPEAKHEAGRDDHSHGDPDDECACDQ